MRRRYYLDFLKLQKQVDFLENNLEFSTCTHLTDVIFDKTEVKNKYRFNRYVRNVVFTAKDLLESASFYTSSLLQ